MNSEKPPMVWLGIRLAAQLPTMVNTSTAAIITSPPGCPDFCFFRR